MQWNIPFMLLFLYYAFYIYAFISFYDVQNYVSLYLKFTLFQT